MSRPLASAGPVSGRVRFAGAVRGGSRAALLAVAALAIGGAQPAAAASIAGLVGSQPQTPGAGLAAVPGATVSAVPAAGGEPVATATSGAGGTYLLDGLPAGQYLVRGEHPGYATTWLPSAPEPAGASVLTVGADDALTGQQLVLRALAAAPVTPQPPPQVPIFDVIPTPTPSATLAVRRGAKLRVALRTRKLAVPVRCAAAGCGGRLELTTTATAKGGKANGGGKAGKRRAAAEPVVLAAGDCAQARRGTLTLKLSAATMRRIKQAGRGGLKATLTVRAKGATKPASTRAVRLTASGK